MLVEEICNPVVHVIDAAVDAIRGYDRLEGPPVFSIASSRSSASRLLSPACEPSPPSQGSLESCWIVIEGGGKNRRYLLEGGLLHVLPTAQAAGREPFLM